MDDIVQSASKADFLQIWVMAINAAGLAATLSGQGPFTIFSPTDTAFAKLPFDTVERLLKDIPKLTGFLTYHILMGKVLAADMGKINWVKTVHGESVFIDHENGFKINNAKIIKTDILASNGIIHLLDSVILADCWASMA